MKTKTHALLLSQLVLSLAYAEVDKEALPNVEDGFDINFFVKEPHIINPSSLCFDKLGRLYVGAGPQYRAPKEDSPTDYIKILIDEDGDGEAETVKTFAEGFNCIEAMAWKGDELWVANAPELTVLRDTDGDDVADEYQVIYTGMNNLRHSVHGLNWGPDGWLYFSIGNTWVKPNAPKPIRDLQGIKSDDTTEYPLTKVYTKETYPKSYHPMNKSEKEGGIFRCRPGGYDLELYARGMRNPWDICMDSGFNWLGTDNDPGRPGERIFMPIRHGHYSMKHPWKFDWMGKHPAIAPSSDLFPGVSGSGTGVVYYTSEHFPEKYRNRYLIADWTNNCIFLYNPKWDGALQVPAETKRKIVDGGVTRAGDLGYKGAKGRSLFRPTDIDVGPDGALYMAGWGSVYGTKYVPKEKWTTEENAKYQGRVFRLRHKNPLIPRKKWDTSKRKMPIQKWNFNQLMEDMGHQVQVWRVNAQDEFVRRGSEFRNGLLKAIRSGNLSESQATWSIWAVGRIDKTSGTDLADIKKFARESSILNLRIQATRILGENKATDSRAILVSLLDDPEPRIRTAAMQSLEKVGWGDYRDSILDAVADEKERVTAYVNWQVMRRQLPQAKRGQLLEDPRNGIRLMAGLSLMEEGDRSLQGKVEQWLKNAGEDSEIEGQVTITANETNFRKSTKVLIKGSLPKEKSFDLRYTLDGSTPNEKSPKTAGEISISKDSEVKAAAFIDKQLVSNIAVLGVHRITDSEWQDRLFISNIRITGKEADLYATNEGLQRGVLAYADDPDTTITSVPDEISGATLIPTRKADKASMRSDFLSFETNLSSLVYVAFDIRSTPPKWLTGEFKETKHVLSTSNGNKLRVHVKEAKAGKIVLGGNEKGKVTYLVFASKGSTGQTTIAATKAILGRGTVNPKRGEAIFFGRGTCFACHRVNGRGVAVGPELAGISKRRDPHYLIEAILNPDAYIVEGYQQTSLEMKGGRKLFGMIQEETAISINLVLLTGEQITVPTEDLKKRSDAKKSGMPASFVYTLSPQDVADVTAWTLTLQGPDEQQTSSKPNQGLSVKHMEVLNGDKRDKVVVSIGNEIFTEYRYANQGKPILYPVIGPYGIPMTRHYPMKEGVPGESGDHHHHQSIHYNHPVSGIDFWHGRGGAHIRNDEIVKAEVVDGKALIVSRNSWMHGDKRILSDTTEISAGNTKGGRFIDYKVSIHASEREITFQDSKEGSMSIRTHPALRLQGKVAKGSAINSEGVKGKAVWGKAAKWVNYWGPVDGKMVGIAIFDHPKNPRHPTTWHARDYGLVTANPFGKRYFKEGDGALTLQKGETVTFAYRFFFHENSHEKIDLPEHYKKWGDSYQQKANFK
ncbi:MAG: c-type cytochrome [Opitutae bacterium]|nr:c-type cytochrome [Opitutae bacterium]